MTKRDIQTILLIFLISLLCWGGILFKSGLPTHVDWGIPPENEQLINTGVTNLYTWIYSHKFTGNYANPLFVSSNQWFLLCYIAGKLHIGGCLFAKLLLYIPFTLCGIFSYLLLRSIGYHIFPTFLASCTYMFSPCIFNSFNMVSGKGISISFALLPLLWYLFIKSTTSIKWVSYAILIGIIMTILNPIFNLVIFITIVALYFLYQLVFCGKYKRITIIKVYLHSVITSMIIFVLLQFNWLIFAFLQGGGSIGELRLGTIHFVLRTNDIIRLMGSYFPIAESVAYYSPIYNISTFIPAALIGILALTIKKLPKHTYFFLILYFLTIFIIRTPIMEYTINKNILPLSLFRDVMKIYVFISFCYLFLLADAFSILVSVSTKLKKYVIVACLFVFLFIYAAPHHSYTFKLFQIDQPIINVIFPKYHNAINNWVSSLTEDIKVLWLPTGNYTVKSHNFDYHIGDFYGGSTKIPGVISSVTERHQNIPELWLLNSLYNDGGNNVSDDLHNMLALFNVKYLILRNDTEMYNWFTGRDTNIWNRTTKMLKQTLSGTHQKNIERIKKIGRIEVFENKANMPHIYGVDKLTVLDGDLNTLKFLADTQKYSLKNNAFVFCSQVISFPPSIKSNLNMVINTSYPHIDLVLPFINDKLIIQPGKYCDAKSVTDGWSEFHQWYWAENNTYQASLDCLAWIKNRSASLLVSPITIQSDDLYEIWAKLFKSKKGSSISFIIADENVSNVVNTQTDDEQFVWEKIFDARFNAGNYRLVVSSMDENSENVLSKVVILPKREMEKYKNWLIGNNL
jgi:hypothetical protein